MSRIYVCHTYYHVFVSILKEFICYKEDAGCATMVLSTMSTDFEKLEDRLKASGIFKEVLIYNEKTFSEFPQLDKYKKDTHNGILNLINRVKFTKKFGKLQSELVPADFKKYDDIFVYCDSDPIGYYLNYKHIKYHAVEDGLNTLSVFNHAKYDNMGMWKLKKFLSLYCNLIFIQDGYSKYCIDVEVNDKDILDDAADLDKYYSLSRKEMMEKLSEKEKARMLAVFVKDMDRIRDSLSNLKDGEKSILILTEPLCSLEVRQQIFTDLVKEYSKEGVVIIKPHPRDELDYTSVFSDYIVIDRTVPMEMFMIMGDTRFNKVVSVFTRLEAITFADEKVFLGCDFMDKYEDPEIHRHKENMEKFRNKS